MKKKGETGEKIYVPEMNSFVDKVKITIVEIIVDGVKTHLHVDEDGYQKIIDRKILSLKLGKKEDFAEIDEINDNIALIDFKKVTLIRNHGRY